MLSYYYGIEYKNQFDELFGNLYIGKNPTENKNKYYILNFDFSGMDIDENNTIEEMQNIFASKVKEGIEVFKNNYNLNIKYNDNARPSEIIGTVERFFATGIAPITLDSMTTGFNIATDVTRKPKFIAMCGFTHNEVKQIIKEVLPEKTEKEQEKIYEKMVKYYDGYRFSEETEETVFNSTLVMYFLKEYLELGKEPEKKLDINIAANFEKLASLITLKNNPYSKEILEYLMQNKYLAGTITDKFNLGMDLNKNDIISILYYFGYATIKDKDLGEVTVQVPNYVMREIYNDYFMYLLSKEGVKVDTDKIKQAIIEVKYIKKQEAESKRIKKKIIAEKREEALEQIQEYASDERLPKDNMKKFIVIYVGDKLELLEEVV